MSKKISKIAVENEHDDVIVKELTIDQIVPNIIDNLLIAIIDGHHTLVLPSNVSGDIFAIWKKNKGGIFSKDVLRYSLNLEHGKYIHIKNHELNCIARIIADDEIDYFEPAKLIDGKIQDTHYMILKMLNNGQKLSGITKNISEKDIVLDEDETININTHNNTLDDETNYHTGSISLLD